MRTKRNKGVMGIIVGGLFIVAGGFLIALPPAGPVPHHDAEFGRYYWEWTNKEGTRVYGFLAVLLGVGVIWLARWPRWGARRSAIDDYVWVLSQELSRRFGT